MSCSNPCGKKDLTKFHMEANNFPKALQDDSIAHHIKEMFAASVEKPAHNFDIMSNNLFDRVMKQVANEDNYRPLYEEYKALMNKKKRKLRLSIMDFHTFYLKEFYQLQFVNRRFANYFARRVKDLPKVSIGVKIQYKAEKEKPRLADEDKGKVIYYIHNGDEIIPTSVCDFLQNIDKVLRFGRVTSHFTVFGLPLDDNLLSAIKKINTSQVTSAHFYNIIYMDFEGDMKKKGQELLSLFPNAETIDFNGTGFDHDIVFGENTPDSELNRHDIELTGREMVDQCKGVSARKQRRKARKMAARASREMFVASRQLDHHFIHELGFGFDGMDLADFMDRRFFEDDDEW